MATVPSPSVSFPLQPVVAPACHGRLAEGGQANSHPTGSIAWEDDRLATLDRYDILDSPREQAFDRITRLTKRLFQVRFVMITLIDSHRAWAKSAQGMEFDEGPRSLSFCQHTIVEKRPLIVPDATLDARFAQNPFVTGEPHLRFYVGVPLTMSDGNNIGTLCIFDTEPRKFASDELELLSDLARMVVDELELRLLATRDSLTGALSRRAFKEEAERAAALALRHHHDLSCVTFDLDHFKAINDTHGHSAGDTVLNAVAQTAIGELREADLLGRLGGEEFAVLLPHTAPIGALEVAEKLRTAIKRLTFEFGSYEIGVTASFGAASLDGTIRDSETLLKHADTALYQAKAEGRDRAVAWHASEKPNAQQLRRVLKGGQILFNGGTSVIDCTVRGLSDNGALIDVSSSVGVPRSFSLAIPADSVEKPCRILSQSEKRIEVEFFPAARAA
jgi:diguanylate cyclase (GGDEF)-like protein